MSAGTTPPDARLVIRAAHDGDSWDLIGLIAACWSDYEGCVLDVPRESPWMRTPATAYAQKSGLLWVAEHGRRVVASAGLVPSEAPGGVELRTLYVARPARRQGLGDRLVALIEDEAERRGAAFVELWTDTRFVEAHRLYERRGYLRGPATRALHDLSESVEFYYRRDLPISSRTGHAGLHGFR